MQDSENGHVAVRPTTSTVELPVGLAPTPTIEYKVDHAEHRFGAAPGGSVPRQPRRPLPRLRGTRVLMWKQDPSVPEIGIRKAYLPGHVFSGPRDARITTRGVPAIVANSLGDFIVSPADAVAFDAIHTFAVVRETLTLYQRNRSGAPLPWQWNDAGNTDPLEVHPHAGVTMNAYYDRANKALKFFSFTRPGDPPTAEQVFTCRSLDIVAHETGHAILDGLKPGWLSFAGPPQTGGLHESFGDLTAIFLTLSQLDQVEAIIAQTKANLHDKSFLSDMAEEFGLALGRPNGLRNADNDLRLSEAGTEVHAISQVFTGGVYDVLADIFAFEQRTTIRDDAAVLYDVGQYVAGLVLRAIIASPATAATYADVVNQMRALVVSDGKPAEYRQFLTERFAFREVVAAGSLHAAIAEEGPLEAAVTDDPDATQDRRGCCGTMLMSHAGEEEDALDEELQALASAWAAEDVRGSGDGQGAGSH